MVIMVTSSPQASLTREAPLCGCDGLRQFRMSVSFVDCYTAIDEGSSLADLLMFQSSFSGTVLIFGEFCIEFADVHTVLGVLCEQSQSFDCTPPSFVCPAVFHLRFKFYTRVTCGILLEPLFTSLLAPVSVVTSTLL